MNGFRTLPGAIVQAHLPSFSLSQTPPLPPPLLSVLELPRAFTPLIPMSQAPFRLEVPPPPAPHLGPSRLFADVSSFLMLFTLNPPAPAHSLPSTLLPSFVAQRSPVLDCELRKIHLQILLEKEFSGGFITEPSTGQETQLSFSRDKTQELKSHPKPRWCLRLPNCVSHAASSVSADFFFF